MRNVCIAGNWKMNMTPSEGKAFAKALAEAKINVLALDQCLRQVNMQFIIDRGDFETAQKALHRELVEKE